MWRVENHQKEIDTDIFFLLLMFECMIPRKKNPASARLVLKQKKLK